MAEYELYHHGIKGMKWGVRRFQNKDGSLTPAGKKKYRKAYDDVKLAQTIAERATGVNGPKSSNKNVNDYVNNFNKAYYDKQAKLKLNNLIKTIGNKGVDELDKDVINEGKNFAEARKREKEILNKKVQELIDKGIEPESNSLFLQDPQLAYDYTYNRYIKENMIRR